MRSAVNAERQSKTDSRTGVLALSETGRQMRVMMLNADQRHTIAGAPLFSKAGRGIIRVKVAGHDPHMVSEEMEKMIQSGLFSVHRPLLIE